MGCTIENHSVHHEFMGKMAPDEIRRESDGCTEKIVEITGEKPHFSARPTST